MPQPPPKLEMCNSVNGKPVPIDPGDDFNLGEYDVSIGKEIDFFIRNPSAHLVADISGLGTGDNKTSFNGPTEIQPLQYAECTFKINKTPEDKIDESQIGQEANFKLSGKIIWSKYVKEERYVTSTKKPTSGEYTTTYRRFTH